LPGRREAGKTNATRQLLLQDFVLNLFATGFVFLNLGIKSNHLKHIIWLTMLLISMNSYGQVAFDSITISRSTIENAWHGANWPDSLKAGKFGHYIREEKTVWKKPGKASKTLPPVISLVNRIGRNGTEDIAKCFIPRHSINFYKNGKIGQYLLVCFECDGVRFSNEPAKPFLKSIDIRDKQMNELKKLFRDML
jgi:hypothetical protein